MANVTMGLPLSSCDSSDNSRALGPPASPSRAVSSLGTL